MADDVRPSIELDKIHIKILAKAKIASKAKKDEPIAKEIESLLRLIKTRNFALEDANTRDPFQNAFREEAMEILDMALSGINLGRGTGWRSLFGHQHGFIKDGQVMNKGGVATAFGGNDIFEEELAAVIAAIEAKATGKTSLDIRSHLVGSVQANVDSLGQELDSSGQEIVTEFMKRVNKKFKTAVEKGEVGLYSKPFFRSGKTDVTGGTISATAELDPAWEHLISLFSGRTFSVKNYISTEHSTAMEISLGSTDYYKALYSALSSVGYSDRYVKKIIFGGMGEYNKYEGSGAAQNIAYHFYHIKYMYELTGVGLKLQDGTPLASADFFIYNEPDTPNVYVRSTAKMILDELENQDPDSFPMKTHIALLKSSFQRLTK